MRSVTIWRCTLLASFVLCSTLHAQPVQCNSFYDVNQAECRPCSDPGGGPAKRSWKDFGNYCIMCALNCPILTFPAETDQPAEASPGCLPSADEAAKIGVYIALDPADPMLDEIASVHLGAAELLTAMVPRHGAVAPIDWRAGFAPFSGMPSVATYSRLRSGERLKHVTEFPGTLIANYFTERTEQGYRLVLRFEGSVNKPVEPSASALGGSVVVLELTRVGGTAEVDLVDFKKTVPLHRIEHFEVKSAPASTRSP